MAEPGLRPSSVTLTTRYLPGLSWRNQHRGEAHVSATHGNALGEGSRVFLEKRALEWGLHGGDGFQEVKERGHHRQEE